MKARQIRIGKFRIGIVGLDEAIEELAAKNSPANLETARQLLQIVKKQNYVADSLEKDYLMALMREYAAYIGQEIDEAEPDHVIIKVLGPGCSACNQLTDAIRNILQEEQISAELEHVQDPLEISKYGILPTPSLVINGRVVLKGKTLSDKKLRTLLLSLLKPDH